MICFAAERVSTRHFAKSTSIAIGNFIVTSLNRILHVANVTFSLLK